MKLWECRNECNGLPQPRITSWYWPFNCILPFCRPSDTLACLAVQKTKENVRFVKVLTMRPPRERNFRWLMRPFLVRLVLLNVFHSKTLDFHDCCPVPLHFPSVSRLSPSPSFIFDPKEMFFVSPKRVFLSRRCKGMHVNHHKAQKITTKKKNNKTHASLNETKAIVVHLWKTIVKWWWWTESLFVLCVDEKEREPKTQKALVDVCLGPGVGIAFVSAS